MRIVFPVSVFLGIIGLFVFSIASALKTNQATIDVVSKEQLVLYDKDNGSKKERLVYTEDDAYTVEDSFIAMEFKSLSTYAKIKEGQRCSVKLQGYRVGLLSMKQNILEVYSCEEKENG